MFMCYLLIISPFKSGHIDLIYFSLKNFPHSLHQKLNNTVFGHPFNDFKFLLRLQEKYPSTRLGQFLSDIKFSHSSKLK